MNENRSIETIMGWLTKTVASKQQISPSQFVEASAYLVILMGDEHTKLYDMEQKVAQMKAKLLETEEKVNKVNLLVNASDEYKEMMKQRAYINRILEFVRIAKIMGKLKDSEIKSY